MVVGLGRLAGRTLGVLANNPLRKGGCLDSLSAEKASRFVRMCDSLGVPLLVIVDVPGYLPGVAEEWGGVVRRGATAVFAWPDAQIAVMGAEAAVAILHRKKLTAVAGQERETLKARLVAEHERIPAAWTGHSPSTSSTR